MSLFNAKPAGTEFDEDEEGGITVLSLFLFVGMLMAAGLAVDINNMVQSRTQLQGAADAAGHAALYWKFRNSEADAKAKAIEIAEMNMPRSRYGDVLATVDIEFGDYIPATPTSDHDFDETVPTYTAVRVTTRRTAANANGLSTFLMKFLGMDILDINTVSVWDHDEGWCPRGEGFFAMDIVDIQSNNRYFDGFCIHSETHVEFQQGNTFQDGVIVSMPDQSDLVVPSSGMNQNTGLADALESITYNLDTFFNDLPNLIDRYRDPYSHVNSTLTDKTVYTKKMTHNVGTGDYVKNAVNILDCKGKTLTIDNNVVIEDAVIITSCEVKFNSGAAIENATLITTDTSSKSISAPSGFRVGSQTFCSTNSRGATLITMGDMTVSSGFEGYGANVIANGDISMTSNANGLAGINFMARGRIDATANGDLGFCNYGPPKPFDIPVFRMVM